MSKYILPFGDWSNDGHGRFKFKTVECEDPNTFAEAEAKIMNKYGRWFFHGMADEYLEPYFSEEVWQALIDTEYPLERFCELSDDITFDQFDSIEKIVVTLTDGEYKDYSLPIELVMDVYLHLVKYFGAEFEIVPDMPMITNVAAPGYGCFDD